MVLNHVYVQLYMMGASTYFPDFPAVVHCTRTSHEINYFIFLSHLFNALKHLCTTFISHTKFEQNNVLVLKVPLFQTELCDCLTHAFMIVLFCQVAQEMMKKREKKRQERMQKEKEKKEAGEEDNKEKEDDSEDEGLKLR